MISVIVPTYNEARQIQNTVHKIRTHDDCGLVKEIIIADGESLDNTQAIAQALGCRTVHCAKGRAVQMNSAAKLASQPVLYFLHADTVPPKRYAIQIVENIERGASSGCFRLTFDHPHWFLQANAWFTRFNVDAFRYGDQSFFIKSELFQRIGGFCESHIIMEDNEIIKRAKAHGEFRILDEYVITSARKYIDNGVFRMQMVFYVIYFLYKLGFSQSQLLRAYRKLIRQDKL